METHKRSILKAISWRTLGTIDTFMISFVLSGRFDVAGSIAGMEVVTKVTWFYLHERAWSRINVGRN